MTLSTPIRRTTLLLACAATAPLCHAIDAGAIDIHGSVSQTLAYSNKYNFLGDTDGKLDANITEIILNGSHRFENGLRFSAQLYAYKLAGSSDIALDFANFDYSFNEHFGVRLGRNKHAFGLYGDGQDVDMLRPFAFLPLDFYDKRLRPTDAAIDGIEAYGNIPLGGVGSVDYTLDFGWIPPIDATAGFFKDNTVGAPFSYTKATADDPILSGNLIWNTPVDGLRFSTSYIYLQGLHFDVVMKSLSDLSIVASDARLIPYALPAGTWEYAIAGNPGSADIDYTASYLSAEYTLGDWQFTAEGAFATIKSHSIFPVLGTADSAQHTQSYYVMATWQATDRWQLGTYYGLGFANRDDHNGSELISVPGHTSYTKDLAVAASFALTDNWLVKGEVHYIDGTKLLGVGNGDAATWDSHWGYYVLKTTLSF